MKILYFSFIAIVLFACARSDKLKSAINSLFFLEENPVAFIGTIEGNWTEAVRLSNELPFVDPSGGGMYSNLESAIASVAFKHNEWSLAIEYGERAAYKGAQDGVYNILAFSCLYKGDVKKYDNLLRVKDFLESVDPNYNIVRKWIDRGAVDGSILKELNYGFESGAYSLVLVFRLADYGKMRESFKERLKSDIFIELEDMYFQSESFNAIRGSDFMADFRERIYRLIEGADRGRG